MPKARSTCTRCSMKRQKCDRSTPCSRCVQNGEAHLCTTQWTNGYDPAVHRKYPRKFHSGTPQHSSETKGLPLPEFNPPSWSTRSTSEQSLPVRPQGSNGSSISGPEALNQPEIPNVAPNTVDFIAYGRSDVADIGIASLLRGKESYSQKEALLEKALNQSRARTGVQETTASLSPAAQSLEMAHLQSLLPPKKQVLLLVDYHDQCMNYWTGATYHAPSFRKGLLEAYAESDELDLRSQDWRWSALLFSILSGAVIGSPEADSTVWGFSNADKLRLSRAWGNAQLACLYLGDYASKFHLHSVQAILNMHTSEHLVGSTKEWAVYQAAAVVIARGLGLHKLGPHPDDGKHPSQLTPSQRDALLEREIGRRVWSALTSQDWLCSTSQGTYTLQKRYYTSIPPRHFNEETMTPIADARTPTVTAISNYLNEIAHTLVRFLDDMIDAPDLPAKYHVVLRYDALMRALALDKMPPFLDPRTPLDPAWPQWTPWARRSFEASCAHKIIMVHQSFLAKSFKDPRYTYSRWACLSSARTILAALDRRLPAEPQWWVEQAFVVTAGLCLGLDLFHHRAGGAQRDTEFAANRAQVEKAVGILAQWPTSSVAAHGTRLLTSLLQELERKGEEEGARRGEAGEDVEFPPNMAPQALAAEASEKPVDEAAAAAVQGDLFGGEAWVSADFDVDMLAFEEFLGGLPTPVGFDSNTLFEGVPALNYPSFL